MFLHIGNNEIIKKENIIGIFNLKTIKNTIEYKKIINNLKEKNLLVNNENIEKNTLIITEEEKNIKGYITNISSTTLIKRIQKI